MFKLLSLATAVAAVSVKKSQSFFGAGKEDNLAKPLSFHQKLLVCNAYPSEEGMVLSKNNVHLKSNEKLAYNSCKYVDGKIFNKDRIGFSMEKTGIEGTFEVEELPQSDSVLLLIAQKRDEASTDLMSFRSFAFPAANPNSNDAQVAFINAVPNTDESERIRMSDANSKMTKESVREEDVKFDHVYVIESGNYDVDIVGGKFYMDEKMKAEAAEKAVVEKKSEKKETKKATESKKETSKKATESKKPVATMKKEEKKPAKKTSFLQSVASHFFTSKKITMSLERGQDYVVLQTGTADKPNLIAFPGPQQQSGILGFFHRIFNWI